MLNKLYFLLFFVFTFSQTKAVEEPATNPVKLTSSFLLLSDLTLNEMVANKQFWGGATTTSLQVQPKLMFEPKSSDQPAASVD
jgi:hypothetical protein